ncbi:beta-1,4-N-acetylgalactosaminyltransferase bre-4 [Caerostris extrusa]|uniref:Beta-1,4-N-acetylgalactosaminyltransferase n=1 Tax=Caerostris extrusa TaxID=172846 RepID=A0AAV4TYQ1_CAEEX|nr:beta-1,4-N-acetylgalactosaminyltransferase bre-4 [Caerostris extrusa]
MSTSHEDSRRCSTLNLSKAITYIAIAPEGRLRLDVSVHNRTDVEAVLRRSPYLRGRGSWTPQNCAAQHRVALIIPYRDRTEHLATLLHTLHPLLQRQRLEYRVYVVEQYGNDTFNKGVLMNAGAREALRDTDFHCFVFHDVDMIPEDDRNLYSCPLMPRHLSVAVDKFNYTLPYTLLVGGVFSIRLEHFLAVNGYSNLYWGWGGEDDDMAYRIKYRKLEILRPPETIARYSMIKHDHRPESPNAIRSALLRMAKKRSSRDGLNTVKYRVVWRHDHLAYTHLMVDIGQHHRWHFLNGQRLIINF